jgi:exodeoxyribonuclease VII large subunit
VKSKSMRTSCDPTTLLDDPTQPAAPRVSQLAGHIKRAVRTVGEGWVEGEVQGRKTIDGHTYFTLADENAQISCIVWGRNAAGIGQWPDEGQLAQVHYDKVDFFARKGRTSLHVDRIRLTGEGALLARKHAILKTLTDAGLVARARRPLPAYPRRVGVIAARDSDVKHDVIRALRERWPATNIVFRPAFVEGVRAVDSVIDALGHLQDIDAVDVIIVARGGGGVRDLVAFDDERLCRAVFACAVPVVTGIGHTPQRPNCDHVAAAFADVPACTAELVVPSAAQLRQELNRHLMQLRNVPKLLSARECEVAYAWARARPEQALRRRDTELDGLGGRLGLAATAFNDARERALDDARHRLAGVRANLPAPSVLDLPAHQLHVAAQRFFDDRADELDDAGRALSAARSRIPAADDIAQLAIRLTPAAVRAGRRTVTDVEQLAGGLAPAAGRLCRNADGFERAFTRLREQADKAFARRLRDRVRDLDATVIELAVRLRRRTDEAGTKLGHIVELIAAHDFRCTGWVLVGDAAGQPVRSTTELATGEVLTLNFHDGRANAAVTDIHQNEGATTNG